MDFLSRSSNARTYQKLYEEQMLRVGLGAALWNPNPSPTVAIGDVGYIMNGEFCLLFRATCSIEDLGSEAPIGFKPLILSPSCIRSSIRKPYPLHTRSVRINSASIGASITTPLAVAPGASLRFQMTRDHGAAFLTSCDTLRLDTSQAGTLRNYIKQHYNTWLDYAQNLGLGEVDLILLSGVDLSRDYAMLTYTSGDYQFSAELTAEIPAVASAWTNIWTTHTDTGPTHFNWGPDLQNTDRLLLPSLSISDSPVTRFQPRDTHITFLRGWRMKRRVALIPTKLEAAVAPLHPEQLYRDDNADEEEVFVSNTPEEHDCYDGVFRYMFANSDANLALLHDDDVASLYKDLDETNERIETKLKECGYHVEVDSDGVATLQSNLPSIAVLVEDLTRSVSPPPGKEFDNKPKSISEDVTSAEGKSRQQNKPIFRELFDHRTENSEQTQRDNNIFAKLPKSSYANRPRALTVGGLSSTAPHARTRSVGSLSQSSGPDPDFLQFSKGPGGLMLSSDSTAVPLAPNFSARAHSKDSGLSAGIRKYYPRARPEDAEMDDDSEEEDDNKLEFSTSLAQQRLEALAVPVRMRSNDRASVHLLPSYHDSTTKSPTGVPHPALHPYDLPGLAAPSTPRTTRRQMLATEMSESLRKNMLWERESSRVESGARRRPEGAAGRDLKSPKNMKVEDRIPDNEEDFIIDGNGSDDQTRDKA